MATTQAPGTFDSYDAIGNREDLADVIYDISPEETPLISNIGETTASATFHEWQTDALAAHNKDNAAVEGAEFEYSDPDPTERVGNRTQIFTKTIMVSGTQDAVDSAGRRSELAYQLSKRGREIKRDQEASYTSSNASVIGDGSTARKSGGLGAWLTTNTVRGATGSDGGYNSGTGVVDAPTPGTPEAFTEPRMKDAIAQAFTAGGDPNMMMLGVFNKQAFSAFAGISDLRTNLAGDTRSQGTIVGAADFYVSDFGTIAVVPNRFQPPEDALIVDPRMASRAVLRPVQTIVAAKTGDADRRVILCEDCLRVNNEAAHAIVADNTTS